MREVRVWHVLRQILVGAIVGAVVAAALFLTSGPTGSLPVPFPGV